MTSSNSSSLGRADASIALLSLVRYFEAVVVEEGGIFLLHLRQFEVVGGDDARDGERRDGLEEQARAVEFVERVVPFSISSRMMSV